jgi:protein-L-isoaspartate(D-aspartate) O-methyltransferase
VTSTTNDTVLDEGDVSDHVRAMVAALKSAHPHQVTASIEQAMLRVPRHRFCPPGTTLKAAYANNVVHTRADDSGRVTSSVSAPWLQARMLHQARIEPGMRVLEVGSGGYNASLIAELVGPAGQVVTVDIDAHVVETTRTALAATEYDDRVTVVHADAAEPLGRGAFDRIIVTVGVWDILPAWIEQLADAGVLVVPLRARHSSECWSIAFRRDHDLLVGDSSVVCGFVDVQGASALHPREARLAGPGGGAVTARTWDDVTDLSGLPATLAGDGVLVSSGVVLPPPGMFVGLRTRLAYELPGMTDLIFENRDLLEHDAERWCAIAQVDGDSLAVLCYWPVDGGHEFGARGFGPRAVSVAGALAGHVAAWDRDGRPQRAAHVYRRAGGTSALEGMILSLPNGDLAVTLHHDGADEI